jgi:hypothetical protein
MKKYLFLIWLIPLFSFTGSDTDQCPVCYGILIKTANSKAEYGKIVHEFKCSLGHSFWKPEQSKSTVEMPKVEVPLKLSCDCPICGWGGHHTSHPNVLKCGNNHEFSCK